MEASLQFQSYSRYAVNSKWIDTDSDGNHIIAIDGDDNDDDKDDDDDREEMLYMIPEKFQLEAAWQDQKNPMYLSLKTD